MCWPKFHALEQVAAEATGGLELLIVGSPVRVSNNEKSARPSAVRSCSQK
jgi:hypothetical protein